MITEFKLIYQSLRKDPMATFCAILIAFCFYLIMYIKADKERDEACEEKKSAEMVKIYRQWAADIDHLRMEDLNEKRAMLEKQERIIDELNKLKRRK